MMSLPRFLPLPIVSAYLGKEFLRAFFFCLLFLWGLALLIDFFDRLDDFFRQDAPILAVVRYFFFKAPLFVSQFAPAAALTGSLLSLSLLSRNREILALKACGIGVGQIALPLLLSAALLSLGTWAWSEFVVPSAFRKARFINAVEIKKKPFKSLLNGHGFWYHGEKIFYRIEHFDPRTNVLSGLLAYTLDDQFRVHSLIEATQATWLEGQWQCEGFQEKFLTPSVEPSTYSCSTILKESPDDFSLVAMEAEEFSSQQLRAFIADLQRKGLDVTTYQVDLQLKSAIPLAILAMTLLGISLAVPGAHQLTLATSLGLALVVGFGYWFLLGLTVSLGNSGALSPLLSAWTANSATCLVGVFFLLGIE
ncbi:MAG: LPS export ABC transporter permease LptG [Deltaproteobacteria bacterium]|nr:LPS export ABC transporter permease LptG [Deltaproteobacteria bacterium]